MADEPCCSKEQRLTRRGRGVHARPILWVTRWGEPRQSKEKRGLGPPRSEMELTSHQFGLIVPRAFQHLVFAPGIALAEYVRHPYELGGYEMIPNFKVDHEL